MPPSQESAPRPLPCVDEMHLWDSVNAAAPPLPKLVPFSDPTASGKQMGDNLAEGLIELLRQSGDEFTDDSAPAQTIPVVASPEPVIGAISHEKHPNAVGQALSPAKPDAGKVQFVPTTPADESASDDDSDIFVPLSIKSPAITPITPKKASEWPSVMPVLKPRVGKDTLSQFRDGVFCSNSGAITLPQKVFQPTRYPCVIPADQ